MLRINNVSKMYKLGQIGGTTLRDELQRKIAKMRGKEDPTKKIGAKIHNQGETFMALNGVSFEVKKGERIGIIGHNGAGKSTLLKLVSRVTAPSGGMIQMNGRVASMLEVGTGFHPELTGRENIYMNGAILGMTKKEIDVKMEDIIEFSECRKFIDTPVKRYSSGMYVKLAFSVAAHLDSEIMIMDEVLAVGDMAFQKKCLDKMKTVSIQDHRTILYVSHNMNTIRQLCDRCIVLSHGKVIFDGDIESAIEMYSGQIGLSSPKLDLTNGNRKNPSSGEVRLQSMEVLNRSKWSFPVGEKLQLEFTAIAKKSVENVGFRFRIQSVEGEAITTFIAPRLFSCKTGDIVSIPVEADTTAMVPGTYVMTPVLFGVNEYGGYQLYDHVFQAITFEITSVPGFNDNTPWVMHTFGCVKLPELVDLRERK